jgi:tight adherence protein C
MSAAVILAAALVGVASACVGRPASARRPRTSDGAPGHAPAPASSSRRLAHTARPARHRVDLDQQFADAVDLVLLAVRCGHLPLEAVRIAIPRTAGPVRPAFEEVDRRVRDGQRFAEALTALPSLLGPRAHALADAFAAADRDGLPLAPVLDRLATEARHDRRRRVDALARQLPVRLAFPLVLCTLPSFVMLAVAPLLLAALHTIRR